MAEVFSDAAAYERFMGRWSAQLARLFAEFARSRKGGRVLDVGCGTGSLAQAIAEKNPEATIVGIDPSQKFIEFCRSRFADPRMTFDRGSALDLPYADSSFDHSLSCLVFHLIPQPEKAASEMRRVTRAGGTVAACTWDSAGMERSAILWEEQIKLDPNAEAQAERPKHCNRQGDLAKVWRQAGLENIEEIDLRIRTEFKSFDEYWLPFLDGVGPTGSYVAHLPKEPQEALKKALRKRLLADRADGPISLGARAWAVRGTVPPG
jgi:SAM-dependent methyltransferase